MQMQLNFTVPGVPVPQARPRVARRGGVYEPPKCTAYKAAVALAAKAAMAKKGLDRPTEGEIVCGINFYLPIPKSWTKKAKAAALGGDIFPTCRPDIDNFSKAVLDGMNGIIYADDGQVIHLTLNKRYSDTPETTVSITGYWGSVNATSDGERLHKENRFRFLPRKGYPTSGSRCAPRCSAR